MTGPWIPTTERLPAFDRSGGHDEESADVLVVFRRYPNSPALDVAVGSLSRDGDRPPVWECEHGETYLACYDVLYWMPIPPLPPEPRP